MKTKILSLVHGEYASHTVKAVEICKKLRDKGDYEIIFSGIGPYMKNVEENGFEYIRTPTLPKEHIDLVLEKSLVPTMFNKEDADYFYNVESVLINNLSPDIILRDLFRDLAGVAAKQKKIFDVSLQLSSCTSLCDLDFRPKNFPGIIHALVPKKILRYMGKKSKKIIRKKIYRNILNKAKESGIDLSPNIIEGFEADMVLLADDPLLFPFGNLRPNYKYTGAILSFEKSPVPYWQQAFRDDKRKKIVVTSGSTGVHDKPEIFIKAFEDNQYAVAVYSNRGSFPDSFYGGQIFNLQSVLPYADVFVTHGGIGSTYLGLQNKVPMLVLPNHFEQQINGRQLEKIGAGISLYPGDICPKNIRKNIELILNEPSFKESASNFSKEMIRNPIERAVNYIEEGYEKFRLKNSR